VKAPQTPERHVSLGGYAAKQCLELLRKTLDPAYPEEWKDEVDSFTQAIMDAGNDFEQNVVRTAIMEAISSQLVIDTTKKMGPKRIAEVLAAAREKTLVVFDSSRDEASIVLRETLTHALCEQPGKVRILWNPRLRKWRKDARGKVVWTNRSAEPDLLYRQGSRVSASPRWGSIDVKFHHAFEGKKKGLNWDVSTLSSPFPDKSSPEAWEGILKKVDALQLAHYHRALEFHGLAGAAIGGIIGKPLNDELKVVWLDLNTKLYERATTSALSLYDEKFAVAVAVAEREMQRMVDPSLEPMSGPEWKSDCATCVWRSTCHDELSVADHITLLPGVTPARAEAHYAAGISDVRSLAKLDTRTAQVVDAGVENLDQLIEQANDGSVALAAAAHTLLAGRSIKSQSKALNEAGIATVGDLAVLDPKTAKYSPSVWHLVETIDQARVVDYARVRRQTHVFRGRGVDQLEIPRANVEIHVDMENDEHIYLWGVRVVWTEGGRTRWNHESFVTFEANDAAEAANTIDFWNYLQSMIAKANARHGEGNVKVFHYTAAEDRCLRSLANKHAGVKGMPSIAEVDAFLESDLWVDLYPLLTNQLVWPTEDLTLKSLAKYVRFVWRDDDPSGSNSVVWYQRAIDPADPEAEVFRQRIIDYNADDCEATAVLLAWLQQYDKVTNLTRKLNSVEDLEARYKPTGRLAHSAAARKKTV